MSVFVTEKVTLKPILPGAALGVLGGGQLGRMFCHAAQSMGYFTAVLDDDAASPAGLVSHHHIQTAYLDDAGLAELAKISAAITTEFENVPAAALQSLAKQRPVSPGAASIAIAQDRVAEKAHFVACAAKQTEQGGADAITVAPYAVIEIAAQVAAISADLLPGILKTARMGYDGKGQIRVKTHAELIAAFAELGAAASAATGTRCALASQIARHHKRLSCSDRCCADVGRFHSPPVNRHAARTAQRTKRPRIAAHLLLILQLLRHVSHRLQANYLHKLRWSPKYRPHAH